MEGNIAQLGQYIGAGLAAIGSGAAAIGVGHVAGNFLAGALRNPSAAAGQTATLFIGIAFAEALGIFSFLVALLLMFAGPLAQGIAGRADPNAYVFAPIIAAATLPIGGRRDLRGALTLAVLFLAIGALCLGLWWLGGRAQPRVIPAWTPLALTVAGALTALLTRPGAGRPPGPPEGPRR